MSQSRIIRLVGYRYDIVGLWWDRETLERQIPVFKRLKQLLPGQSGDALLETSTMTFRVKVDE